MDWSARSARRASKRRLRRNPATEDVIVSLENKLVAIGTKEGQDIPDVELRKALTDAGYDVKAITRTQRTIDRDPRVVRRRSDGSARA